jgi:hypothetical protein
MFSILAGIAFIILGAERLVPVQPPLPQIAGACLLVVGILILLGV